MNKLKTLIIAGLTIVIFLVLSSTLYETVSYAGDISVNNQVVNVSKSKAIDVYDFDIAYKQMDPMNITIDELEIIDDGSFTIWIMSDFNELPAGTKLKAVDVDDKYIYTDDELEIPRNICLANLPDILQPEMQYLIHNAVGSQFHVREYDLDGISGEILYPGVMQDDNSFYVPLLYDVAMKLYDAEEIALSKGYTLKVYDAYRPYVVTTDIYKKMSEIVAVNKDINNAMTNRVGNASYDKSWFLASGRSNHNFGVAVDITIADLETGEELEMQTKMVDLSNASATCNNNENANTLRDIMIEAGFGTLVSEWWHFEIKEYRKNYGLFQIY